MAKLFDARGRRAPLAAALATMMLGAAGVDAYAGSSAAEKKTGVAGRQEAGNRLDMLRGMYGTKRAQPGSGHAHGAMQTQAHRYQATAQDGARRKVDIDRINRLAQTKPLPQAKVAPEVVGPQGGAKPRKLDMKRIDELAQHRPPAKLKVVPKIVDTRWPGVGRTEPGRQLQSRGVDDRGDLPRPALARYGYKPLPSFDPVAYASGSQAQRHPKPTRKQLPTIVVENGDPDLEGVQNNQALDIERQALPHPVSYRGVELKDLSAAEAALALLKSDDAWALFGLDAAGRDLAHEQIKALLDEPELPKDFGHLWETMAGKTFDLAGRSESVKIYTFEHLFKQEVEVKLWEERVFGFKLPNAMSFQQLPYPEHIVAVVARVTDSTTRSPRYVVAHIDASNRLDAPGGFKSLGYGWHELGYDEHEFDAGKLTMTQVEYVVYEPYFHRK